MSKHKRTCKYCRKVFTTQQYKSFHQIHKCDSKYRYTKYKKLKHHYSITLDIIIKEVGIINEQNDLIDDLYKTIFKQHRQMQK